MDVRKSASDAMATLALFIKSQDIPAILLRIPLQLVHDATSSHNRQAKSNGNGNGQPNADHPSNSPKEDLCITASHLLADIASIDPVQVPPPMVAQHITPTIRNLCNHPSFRVRRAAVQALPRVVSGSTIHDASNVLIPVYMKMGSDQGYRVRKSVGECLVDMSRSLMLLGSSRVHALKDHGYADGIANDENDNVNKRMHQRKLLMQDLRRKSLVPTCTKLLQDSVKAVRHSMMQFLGPFIASFYPLDGNGASSDSHDDNDDGIINTLGGKETEKLVGGMGVQFFPHANGMVSRLSPETITSPTFIPGISKSSQEKVDLPVDSLEYFQSLLPEFVEKCDNDSKSLVNILRHRAKYPPSMKDVAAVTDVLLPPYVQLASVSTGDDNIDAEMRVYCAYSLPAVVLLLGKESWDSYLKKCFLELITDWSGNPEEGTSTVVPLPVKRCLASSFHTICNTLGSSALKGTSEEKANKQDLLTVFEIHFLRDADDTVRLNVIRNLPSFLSLLSFSKRSKYLPVLYEIIRGDTMLASKRKNALNPILLNWRQRDMIAQIMPNLISLYRPDQVRQYLWPVIKILLSDSVNLVRQNVEWSIPILLRCYEFSNCMTGKDDASAASNFSAEACNEVYDLLKATLLDNKFASNKITACGAFSKRQSYCRILSSVALILRLNENRPSVQKDHRNSQIPYLPHPFYPLGKEGYKHLHHLLKTLFLPPALAMKDDTVTNVRLTLAKSLRVMPIDIRDSGEVNVILRTLEDEIETWEGGGGQNIDAHIPKVKVTSAASTSSKSLTGSASNLGSSSTLEKSDAPTKSKISMSGQQMQDENGASHITHSTSNEDDSNSLASI